MKIIFDKKNDILRIKLSEGNYSISKEINGVIVDLSKENKILAIEILDIYEKINSNDFKEINLSFSEVSI